VVEDFQKNGGKPIVSDALKAAGVEITAYTKEQMDEAKQAGESKKNKKGLQGALADVFAKMFSLGEVGPNDIVLRIKDPNRKIVDIEFQNASGKKVKDDGTSSNGENEETTRTFNFESKLPENTRLIIYLLTEKSLVSVPFSLKDTFLP
jgi:hypothetical protein